MTAWSPWERRLCFLLPFSMRMVLCAVRFLNIGGGDPASFIHLILQVCIYFLFSFVTNFINCIHNFLGNLFIIYSIGLNINCIDTIVSLISNNHSGGIYLILVILP